jgi:membrane protease YdiL (CAAX protease family)
MSDDHPAADAATKRISLWWLAAPAALFGLNFATAHPAQRNAVYSGTFVAATAVSELVVIGYVFAAVRFSRAPTRDTLALRRPGPPLRRVAVMTAIAAVLVAAVELVFDPLVHADTKQGITPNHTPHSGRQWLVLLIACLVLCLVVPFAEELLFRGLTFAALGRYAVPGSAALFAVAHGLVALLVPTFVAGLVLAELRRRTDSVFPGMVAHAALNGTALALALLAA